MKKNIIKNQEKKSGNLFLSNIMIIFFSLFSCFLMIFVAIGVFLYYDIISSNRGNWIWILLMILGVSILIGSLISFLAARTITKPIHELEKATEQITKGNFDIQVPLVRNQELNRFIQNFNIMAKELKSNETLKNDFVSNVSHEFKTPLAVIQAYSKYLRRADLDEKTKKQYEEVIDSNIKKLTNLTSNILSLSKIENQQIVANKTNFLLDEQIRQSILFLEPEWSKKNIEFDLSLPKTQCYGSQDLLSQVWQNIIGNAIKYSDNDKTIKIKLFEQENKINIEIADEGIGMSEETQKHIFDKFFQGDKSRSADGNGLGLALVSRILKICDGEISVVSQEKKGTTFVVSLKTEKPSTEENKKQEQ